MQVKVCGITNQADAFASAQAGVTYIGYIMNYPKSPRYVTADAVLESTTSLRAVFPNVSHVGVFVNEELATLCQKVQQLKLDIVQLHGDESIEYITELHEALPALRIWKTVEVQQPEDIALIEQYASVPTIEHILLDSGKGSGKLIDAELLTLLPTTVTYGLAGGISAENIQEQVSRLPQDLQLVFVDVNSGVESVPGKKDAEKLTELFSVVTAMKQ